MNNIKTINFLLINMHSQKNIQYLNYQINHYLNNINLLKFKGTHTNFNFFTKSFLQFILFKQFNPYLILNNLLSRESLNLKLNIKIKKNLDFHSTFK